MRRIEKLALVAFVLALSLAPGLKAQNKNQAVIQELTKIKQEWSEAELKKDIPFLNKLWANDCVFGTSLGTVMNKQQLIELIKGTNRKVTELHSEDIHIRLYGNTAIMTDHTTMRGVYNGKPYGGVYRYVRIFRKEGGTWRVVLVQATPVKAVLP